ncbi:MAG: glycosyl transferase [Muribaculaceae bacterium]|nr:glycosyl transferase [Muribaculaceae bacterium]
MIPKIIHFCWLSNDPYPSKIRRCIDTWSRMLPDYEIWLWDFSRLGNAANDWVHEAFDRKKYAFAADFIRVYALYNYGGIYLDSDVELVKSFDQFLHLPYFFCRESGGWAVEAACMGAEKGHPFFKYLVDHYKNRHFVRPDGSLDMLTMPEIMQQVVDRHFKIKHIDSIDDFDDSQSLLSILPSEYFSPIDTRTMELRTTRRTVAIHHFAASWCSPSMRLKKRLQRMLGAKLTRSIMSAKRIFQRTH